MYGRCLTKPITENWMVYFFNRNSCTEAHEHQVILGITADGIWFGMCIQSCLPPSQGPRLRDFFGCFLQFLLSQPFLLSQGSKSILVRCGINVLVHPIFGTMAHRFPTSLAPQNRPICPWPNFKWFLLELHDPSFRCGFFGIVCVCPSLTLAPLSFSVIIRGS